MDSTLPYLIDHWHSLLESVGIIGGLLFTGITVRRDLEARRVSEQLTLATQHRRLWGQLHRRKSLSRMLEPDRNLEACPVSREEELFLSLSFVHFHTGWLICRDEGSLTPLSVLAADAGHFFRLPVPRAVWQKVRATHQPEFVTFIEESVRSVPVASENPETHV